MIDTIFLDVKFLGLEALERLKLPDFSLGGLDGLKGSLTAVMGVGAAALGVGMVAAVGTFKVALDAAVAGVQLRSEVSKTFSRGSALAGEDKQQFKQTLDPVISKLISNPAVNTPVKDIQELITNLAGLGLSSKDIAIVAPNVQEFAGATGEAISVAGESLVKQLNRASLPLNDENLRKIIALNTAVLNTSPLKLDDIQVFNKYAQIKTDGSKEQTLNALRETAILSAIGASKGGTAESIGVGLRAFQTAVVDTKKLRRGGFQVTENASTFTQLTEILKNYVTTRNEIGTDKADAKLELLVGDSGLGFVKQLTNGVKSAAEVEKLMSESAIKFDEKVGSAGLDMANAARAAVADIDGAFGGLDAAKEGFTYAIGRAIEGLANITVRGATSLIGLLFPLEELDNLKPKFDGLVAALSGIKLDFSPLKELGIELVQWVGSAVEFVSNFVQLPAIVSLLQGGLGGVKSLSEGVLLTVGGIGQGIAIVVQILSQLGLGDLLALVGELAKTVGIIVSGVIGVVGQLVGVQQQTAPVISGFKFLVILVQQVNGLLQSAFNVMGTFAGAINNGLIQPMQQVASVMNSGLNAGLSALFQKIGSLGQFVLGIWQNIANLINSISVKIGAIQNFKLPAFGGVNNQKNQPQQVNVRVNNFGLESFSKVSLQSQF